MYPPGKPSFHPLDYTIFALLMLISSSVGVFFAVTGGRQRTISEYILANRRMKIAPVVLSLVVSFESSIMMLGFPTEMYAYGVQFWTFHISLVVCIALISLVLVPLLHPLKITSVYEYLEQRYSSGGVRMLGSFLGILNNVWYMGIVLYGPATALQAVTGYPLWNSVVVVSVGAVFYTAIGGIKAVIWTDAIQFVVMAAGIVTVIIFGCKRAGGIHRVFDICREGGRLQFFDLDPTTRHTFWNLVIAGMIRPIYLGLNQASIQRISSMKTMRSAQIMMMLSYPGFLLFGTLACLQGLIAYANFVAVRCDPYEAKLVTNPNQIMPYFVMDLFKALPGLPGVFLASLFSASLSTLSSALSGNAALVWTDFLKPHVPEMSEARETLIVKLIVVLFGCLSTGIAFLVLTLEGPLTQIAGSIIGSINGPLVGMFLLGALFPAATAKGAFLGASVTMGINLWLVLGSFLCPDTRHTPFLQPAPVSGCYQYNNATVLPFNTTAVYLTTDTATIIPDSSIQRSALSKFYSLSYQWFSIVGMGGTILVGLLFSYITGANKAGEVSTKYVIPIGDRLFCYLPKTCRSGLFTGKSPNRASKAETESFL